MVGKKKAKTREVTLRERAKELLRKAPRELSKMAMKDIHALVFELQIHQVELEMQNEELRCAQAELAHARDHLADLYELAPVAYLTLDRNGKILEANLTAAAKLRTERGSLIGQNLSKFEAASSRDVIYHHRLATLNSNERLKCEVEMVRSDGTQLTVCLQSNAFDAPGGRCCRTAFVDITAEAEGAKALSELNRELEARVERRTAQLRDQEEKEREAAELFRLTFDGAPSGFLLVDNAGVISQANAKSVEIFGYAKDELIGFSIQVLVPEADRSAYRRYQEEYLAHPEPRFIGRRGEIFGRRKDGSPVPVEVGLAPIVTQRGAYVLASVVDVSTRKIAERETARREDAERINQAKDDFMVILSHELRTPLNSILGWIHLVKRRQGDPAVLQQGLSAINDSARAQAQLINDILDVGRIVSGKFSLCIDKVSLEKSIGSAINAVLPLAQAKGITIKSSVDKPVQVKGDSQRLVQCLWNLLTNAIKFTQEGGHIEVRLRTAGNSIEIEVQDDGQGIKPEILPHIFERYRQADTTSRRVHGGLGLGLAIVKHIVELHGGEISVQSKPESGSLFCIKLPYEGDIAEGPVFGSSEEHSENWERLKDVKVLIVEDNIEARELLREQLSDAGAKVIAAGSAEEGILNIKSGHPDVIVSDIAMPHRDGYQFMEEVRRLASYDGGKTPAIALTAHARPEDRRRALAAGYQEHLAKPVDPSSLLSSIVRVLGVH